MLISLFMKENETKSPPNSIQLNGQGSESGLTRFFLRIRLRGRNWKILVKND